jgi:hypothetical protein
MTNWERLTAAALAVILVVAVGIAGNVRGQGLTLAGAGSGSRSGYVGPGDIIAYTMWHGLRAYSSAHCTGSVNAVQLRRTSDNALANIPINTSCDLDMIAAAAHCGSGGSDPCFARTQYAQIGQTGCGGATCDVVQTTDANQEAFIFNCLNGRPCLQSTTAAQILTGVNNNTPNVAAMATVSYVGQRSVSNAATVNFAQTNNAGNRIQGTGAAATWQLNGASGTITRAAAENSFHVAIGVTGTGAVLNIDGAETPGTVAGGTAAGPPTGYRGGTSTTTLRSLEGGAADNLQATAGQRATLVNTTRSYYGF